MILLFDKTKDDLNKKAEAALLKAGFNISPGSIAKLLLGIINESLSDFYETLKINHLQSFVSSATGDFLKAIGSLVNCTKLDTDTDDTYRLRITKQILNTATANETSIRIAALSIPSVQDVVLKGYSYGAGSFTVLVVTEDLVTNEATLVSVYDAVNEVVGYGIKFNVINPDINTVKIKIKLLVKDYISDGQSIDVRNLVRIALQKYLTSRAIGEELIINEISQIVMDVDNTIIDYTCEDFRINNVLSKYINQGCRWNERYMLSTDPSSIIIN